MKTVAFIRGTGIYNDSRPIKQIQALLEEGYCVKVLGWDRTGIARKECNKIFSAYSENISFAFYDVVMGKGIGMKNIHKLLGWLLWVRRELSKLGTLSAVHACDLDTGIPARMFCAKYKVKLVYDVFDYYVDTHPIPAFLQGWVERQEIKTINYADVTIICTEERKEQIAKTTPKKLIVIHNSPEVNCVPDVEEEMDYFYCGAMSRERLITEILDEYSHHRECKITFAGIGPFSEKAEKLATKYENFSFLGPLPYDEVLSLEAKAKVLAAIYKPTKRNHKLCAPNKFYESLALGKPVIVCRGTGIDKIVEKNNIGCVIDYDAQQFYDALQKLCSDDALRKEMGLRARTLYEALYDWKIMKKIMQETYKELIAIEVG